MKRNLEFQDGKIKIISTTEELLTKEQLMQSKEMLIRERNNIKMQNEQLIAKYNELEEKEKDIDKALALFEDTAPKKI